MVVHQCKLSPYTYQGRDVWLGKISRDIGFRFTMASRFRTSHKIDPDVDESRDYLVEDLAAAGIDPGAGEPGCVGTPECGFGARRSRDGGEIGGAGDGDRADGFRVGCPAGGSGSAGPCTGGRRR